MDIYEELLIKPLWYIEEKTVVAILQALKNLNDDLKKEIITIIVIKKSEEDYYNYEINYRYDDFKSNMSLSDYYFSE